MAKASKAITMGDGTNAQIILDVYPKTAWFVYRIQDQETPTIDPEQSGKWLIAGMDMAEAGALCILAEKVGAARAAKHTINPADPHGKVICCFYINGDSVKEHRRILDFLKRVNALPKKKDGAYCNISFKFDSQTLAGEYGKDFVARYHLSDFMNLETGEFINREVFTA